MSVLQDFLGEGLEDVPVSGTSSGMICDIASFVHGLKLLEQGYV